MDAPWQNSEKQNIQASWKDFVSFAMKNIHPFDVASTEIYLFLFKLAICEFLPLKFSNTQLMPNATK